MRLGITAFLTDRDMAPADLARAVEERGFHSLYLPEHTHLPVRADTPPALVEGVHLEDYRRSLDPFVALATAAAVTERILLGTGVVLAAQHDPIVLAKQIATLDHLSGGRVVFGMGFGWNRAEAADHGVAFAERREVAREHVLCMQALWSQEQAEFHGELRVPRPVLELAQAGAAAPGAHPHRRRGPPEGVRRHRRVRRRLDAGRRLGAGRRPAPAAPGRRGSAAATPTGSGWSRSAPSPPRRSWPTTSAWGSTRWCSGCRRAGRPRCWPPWTPTPPTSSGSAADDA